TLAKRKPRNRCERTLRGQSVYKARKGLLGFPTNNQVNEWISPHGADVHYRCLWPAERNHCLSLQQLDFRCDTKRKRIAAAYRAEAKEIAFARGKIRAGKATKIGFVLMLPPFIVDTIQVHDFRLQTRSFQYCSEA